MALIIDEEFAALIPPLTPEEFKQLEDNCIQDGIRDPLVTWNGTLVDGHNRLKIAMEHDLPFDEKEMYFKDKEEAKKWIILNQFGRRNLSAYDRSVLALKLKPLIAERAKEKQSEAGGAVRQKSDKAAIDTKKELAKVAGVSHDTIHRVEAIQNSGDKELIRQVRDGETTINRAYQVVKGIEPIKTKSPAEMKREHLETAKKEHEAFTEQKVVTLEDVTKDRQNRRTIAVDMYRDLTSMGKRIGEIDLRITAGDTDIRALSKELTPEERKDILDLIGAWRQMLTRIAQEVTGN